MACITTLEQDAKSREWSGVSIRDGTTHKFKTLQDYERYTQSLQQQGTYCPTIEPQHTDPVREGKQTTRTGFLEFQPRDPEKQAKYSAMSPTWEGVESSEAAVARGDYSLDSAEATRRELREKVNVPIGKPPTTVSQNCVVQ